jgi:hypothetical protein
MESFNMKRPLAFCGLAGGSAVRVTSPLAVCGLVGLLLLSGCGKGTKEGADGANASSNSDEWTTFDPEQGKFTVLMPGTPVEQRSKGVYVGKKWTLDADGLTYTIRYDGLSKSTAAPDENATEIMIGDAVDLLPFDLNATKVGDDTKLVGGQPGRELVFEFRNKTRRRLRVCVASGRMYWLEVTGTKELVNSINANTFLDSLKLAP